MSTWNGIGTRFYGTKDQGSNNSFVTTEWFVVFHFPIIPLGSYRVIFEGTQHGFLKTTRSYIVIEKRPIDWSQVFTTYFIVIASVALAIWLSKVAGNWFPKPESYGFAVVIGFLLPLFISKWVFLDPNPPKNEIQESRNEMINKDKNIDLLNIPKPQITPPSDLLKPDLSLLKPLIDRYTPIVKQLMQGRDRTIMECLSIKSHVDDVFFANFQSISFFMEKEVYQGSSQERKWFEERIDTATTALAIYSWMIGKEWGIKDKNLRARLHEETTIDANEIPFDAMVLLTKAINIPYYIFAVIFTDYYESGYGERLHNQKDGHLKDTYQSFTKAAIACFLIGIKS